ncbi:hypothetical protein CVT26_009544 [Gymnopilus dilepis]|uniref:Acyl-protein thioesterase 1 n=1 Tax=Gymnopilus dilepis TaxID=231916 RepID=A0A409VKH5_9AGAR|nr:hypothetical protein CVT26_009544 [Gymnopilus dilepis]
MAAAPLETLVVPAVSRHTATVIFIHGLGDRAEGMKPIIDRCKKDEDLSHVKWVLPYSPVRALTANMGIVMPSWFDILSFGLNSTEDEDGMRKSARLIQELIESEIRSGTDPSRIVIGGFSQGATMSLLSALTGSRKLAGIAVLSGWIPLKHKFKELASPIAASIPIFWGTGSADQLVKLQYSKECAEFLNTELGFPTLTPDSGEIKGLSYNVYDGLGHETTPSELDDLKSFIKRAIPKS